MARKIGNIAKVNDWYSVKQLIITGSLKEAKETVIEESFRKTRTLKCPQNMKSS